MAASLLGVGIASWTYLRYCMAQKQQATLNAYEKSVGDAQVGGPFKLTDTSGKPFSSEQLKGEFSMLYFGFTHCPDICPDELEKLAEAIDMVGVSSTSQAEALMPASLFTASCGLLCALKACLYCSALTCCASTDLHRFASSLQQQQHLAVTQKHVAAAAVVMNADLPECSSSIPCLQRSKRASRCSQSS